MPRLSVSVFFALFLLLCATAAAAQGVQRGGAHGGTHGIPHGPGAAPRGPQGAAQGGGQGGALAPGLTVPGAPFGAGLGQGRNQDGSGYSSQPRLFTHPARHYSLPIPPEVDVSHRGTDLHVGIRSRSGYVISVQTGDHKPDLAHEAMIAILEERYLGEQGPWSLKLDQQRVTLKGLPAIETRYDGNNSRTRVVVARGKKTDFVFMFVAPRETFLNHVVFFDWMLENFQPAQHELSKNAALSKASKPEAKSKPEKTDTKKGGDDTRKVASPTVPVLPLKDAGPAAAKASAGSAIAAVNATGAAALRASERVEGAASGRLPKKKKPAPAATNQFNDPGFGFVMDYPKEWEVTRPRAHTAMFSGPEGSPAFDAVVSVQNVQPPGAASASEAAGKAMDDLKSALSKDADGLKYIGESKLTESPGTQIMVSYTYSGRQFRKWAVVVPRPSGTVAHVWSFTAPVAAFKEYRAVAENMLRSWTLTP